MANLKVLFLHQKPGNIEKGLPVLQGKHSRFVYDSDDEDIVDVIEVDHSNDPFVFQVRPDGEDTDSFLSSDGKLSISSYDDEMQEVEEGTGYTFSPINHGNG